jgi:hypothetical protein
MIFHVPAMISSYPLAAALGRRDVANSSAVFGAILYVVLAGALLIWKAATPIALAWLMVISDAYVLLHCSVLLWPAPCRQHSQWLAGKNLS